MIDSSRRNDIFLTGTSSLGQAYLLGILMGFFLIDWGEEFRAKLEDWLFSSELEETGPDMIWGYLMMAIPASS